MKEPTRKKPGPKPKCKECGRKEGEGHGDDCPVGMGVYVAAPAGGFIPLPGHEEARPAPAVRHEWEVVSEIKAAGPVVSETVWLNPETHTAQQSAQAYALRVWNGQATDLPRKERIERVKRALDGQNLPFEGVELP